MTGQVSLDRNERIRWPAHDRKKRQLGQLGTGQPGHYNRGGQSGQYTYTNTNTNNLFLTARYTIHDIRYIEIHHWVLVLRGEFGGGHYGILGRWGCM
jgi:hypothetical protein